MLNRNFKKALTEFTKIMNQLDVKWSVIGSTNMAIQGIDIQPQDLDIVVLKDDLEKTKNVFSKFLISDIKNLDASYNREAWEVKLQINNVDFQILGEPKNGLYSDKLTTGELVYIKINGLDIPCRPLEAEAEAYVKTNRNNKAKIIKQYLEK